MIPDRLQVGDKIIWGDCIETVLKTRKEGKEWQVKYDFKSKPSETDGEDDWWTVSNYQGYSNLYEAYLHESSRVRVILSQYDNIS